MNRDTTEFHWNRFLARVRERWDKLTADDVDRLINRDELVAAIQQRYGVGPDEAERQVHAFESTYGWTMVS